MSNRTRTSRLEVIKQRVGSWKSILVGLPSLYLLAFFGSALAMMFVISFWTTQQYQLTAAWTVENYVYLLTSSSYHVLLFRSVAMAVSVTAASLLIGYPIAYYIARGIDEQQLPVLLLFAAPFFVGAMLRESAHQALIGANGLASQLLRAVGIPTFGLLEYGLFQVFLGEVYLWFPFMMLSIYLSLELVDHTLLDAAIDAGASPAVAFKEVTWPLSLPGVAMGSILVFVSTLVSHLPSRFIGGASGSLIGNSVKELFGAGGAWPTGAALGTILIVISFLFVTVVVGYTFRSLPTLAMGESE